MFLAVDLSSLLSQADIRQRMAEYRDYIRGIPTVSGNPLIFPGELEARCMIERLKSGIPIPETLYQEFNALIETYQLSVRL